MREDRCDLNLVEKQKLLTRSKDLCQKKGSNLAQVAQKGKGHMSFPVTLFVWIRKKRHMLINSLKSFICTAEEILFEPDD